MKTFVLAEKPSQARDFYLPLLQKISGEKLVKKGNYYESQTYYLSWFFGHLMRTLEPVEYDAKYKNWSMDDLPIMPEPIQYCYRDNDIKIHGELLLNLCRQSDLIVCATDPDREGEGIFRAFYDYHKINKPVKRLWAVSLNDEDLFNAWNNMKSGVEYD
ncbi:MAG: DNA topoisomerase III, partial [Candidatus Omnitrophica bacterium]|nr:DNA topoisomerase III [Candidatus Omnitrophota bacterium]